jgi:hypothetical protein
MRNKGKEDLGSHHLHLISMSTCAANSASVNGSHQSGFVKMLLDGTSAICDFMPQIL